MSAIVCRLFFLISSYPNLKNMMLIKFGDFKTFSEHMITFCTLIAFILYLASPGVIQFFLQHKSVLKPSNCPIEIYGCPSTGFWGNRIRASVFLIFVHMFLQLRGNNTQIIISKISLKWTEIYIHLFYKRRLLTDQKSSILAIEEKNQSEY